MGRVYINPTGQQNPIEFVQQGGQPIASLGGKDYNARTLAFQRPYIGLEQAPDFGTKKTFRAARLRGNTDEHVPILHCPAA